MTSLHDRHIKPLILAGLNGENWRLKDYESRGGYQQLRRIISDKVAPDAIIAELKASLTLEANATLIVRCSIA
jgi:NADH-quinone oxidoreductase subunit F